MKGSVIAHFCENYEIQDIFTKASTPVTSIEIYGGIFGNCAEDACSECIDANAETLVSIVYCPLRIKGGLFIRQDYHKGNREEGTLPSVTRIAMNLYWFKKSKLVLSDSVGQFILPNSAGWIIPKLERLVMVCDDMKKYDYSDLEQFIEKAFETYPLLQQLSFVEHTIDESIGYVDLFSAPVWQRIEK